MDSETVYRLALKAFGDNGNAARVALISATLIFVTAIAIVVILQFGGAAAVDLGPLHVVGTQAPAVTG
jgi:hypothetical protein